MIPPCRPPHRSLLPSALAVLLATISSMAVAQSYHRPILIENQPPQDPRDPSGEDQPGVMTRAYPEFSPPGITLGGFTLTPRLMTDIGYSDNIYARPRNTQASAIGVLTPEAELQSNWSRHLLQAAVSAEAKRYASEKSENVENYRVSLGGGLDIATGSVLTGAVKRQRFHDLRGDPENEVRTREPTPFDLTAGDIAFQQQLGDLSFRLEGSGSSYEFQSGTGVNGRTIDGADRSYATLGGLGRVSYALSPDFSVFGEGGWQNRTYDRPRGNGLSSRNSTGPTVNSGFSFALGGLWSGEVAVGYAERDIDDAKFGSVSAMTARASLLWNVTRATSLRGQAVRAVGETAVGPSVAYIGTTYWFGIEHQLQSDLLLGANVSTRTLDYVHSPDQTDILSVGARATWFINRNFRAQAEYNFSRRDGTLPDSNFDRNIGMLRFVSSF